MNFFFKNKKKYSLYSSYRSNAGRTVTGTISVRHRGGSRIKRSKFFVSPFNFEFEGMATLENIQRHHSTNSFVSLMKFAFGAYSYTLTPHGCFPGTFFLVTRTNYIYLHHFKVGFITMLKHFDDDSMFFNFVLNFEKGSQYARAAGTYCLMIQNYEDKKLSLVKLPTNKTMWVS